MSGMQASWLLFSLLSRKPSVPTPPYPTCPLPSPRAMRRTRMMRMMVGLMGSAALISISSSVMPMTDSSTMAKSSWFHLLRGHRRPGVGNKVRATLV